MGKVHKSLRIDEEAAAGVEAQRQEGESEAAAYNRVILAGLDALEAGEGQEAPTGGNQEALTRSLAEHIDTLKAANEELSRQLAVKDSQIDALTAITQAAQALQGFAHKQLAEPSPGEVIEVSGERKEEKTEDHKKRGFFSRIFG